MQLILPINKDLIANRTEFDLLADYSVIGGFGRSDKSGYGYLKKSANDATSTLVDYATQSIPMIRDVAIVSAPDPPVTQQAKRARTGASTSDS